MRRSRGGSMAPRTTGRWEFPDGCVGYSPPRLTLSAVQTSENATQQKSEFGVSDRHSIEDVRTSRSHPKGPPLNVNPKSADGRFPSVISSVRFLMGGQRRQEVARPRQSAIGGILYYYSCIQYIRRGIACGIRSRPPAIVPFISRPTKSDLVSNFSIIQKKSKSGHREGEAGSQNYVCPIRFNPVVCCAEIRYAPLNMETPDRYNGPLSSTP